MIIFGTIIINAMNRLLVNRVLFLFIVLYTSASCIRYGDWDDNINLSVRSVKFDAHADSVVITTKGSGWWITDVSVDSAYYVLPVGLNQQADNYAFTKDCFVIERRNRKTLFIKVDANTAYNQRIITIGLESGDYFDRVIITQKSK